MPNIYFRIWIRFTVWMLRHDKFSYAYLWESGIGNKEFEVRLQTYKQGWPWVDANLQYISEELEKCPSTAQLQSTARGN